MKTTLITLIASIVISPFVRNMTPVQCRFTGTGTVSPVPAVQSASQSIVHRAEKYRTQYKATTGQTTASRTGSDPECTFVPGNTAPTPSVNFNRESAEASPPNNHVISRQTHNSTVKRISRRPSIISTLSFSVPKYNTLLFLVPLLWLTGSMFLIVRTIMGLWNIWRIKSSAVPVTEDIHDHCREIADMLGIATPDVLVSPHVDRAFMFGVIRPFIMLPPCKINDAHTAFDVLVHELAHLKERDNAWNHVCRLSKIIMPLQPLLWVLSYRIVEVSEYICDDYVVQYSRNRLDYASRLVSFALDTPNDTPLLAEGAGIISFKSQLRRRIERIVDFSHIPDVTIRENRLTPIVFTSLAGLLITGFMSFGNAVTVKNFTTPVDTIDSEALKGEYTDDFTRAENEESGGFRESPPTASIVLSEQPKQVPPVISKNGNERPSAFSSKRGNSENTGETTSSISMPIKTVFADYQPEIHSAAYSTTIMSDMELQNLFPARHVQRDDVKPEKTAYEYRRVIDSSALLSERLIDPAEMVLNIGRSISNRSPGEATTSNLAKLEIVIPDVYIYGDMSDPDQKKMSDFYHSLKKNKKYPVWSPDGDRIAFNDSDYGVWIVDADGGEPLLIYDNYYKLMYQSYNLHYGELQTIGFSPDGEEIAFRRYGIDMEQGTRVIIDEKGEVALYHIENPLPVIESVNIGTGESRILAESGLTGDWSRSGDYFAYISVDMDSVKELWILDVEDDSRRQLESTDPVNVRFMPDDSGIIVSERDVDGMERTLLIDIVSGERNELLAVEHASFSDISPDGRRLLCTDMSSGSRFLYDMQTGDIEDIPLSGTSVESVSAWGRFSYDGSKLCISGAETDENETAWNIYICDMRVAKTGTTEADASGPSQFSITGNFPNPFNMSTSIEFTIAESGHATLDIYNTLGQKVRGLVGGRMDAGAHRVTWNGRDDDGVRISTGMYVAALTVGDRREIHKMMVMK